MNTASANAANAGWHPDPTNPSGGLRWWDGLQWTAHTHPAPTVQQPAQAAAYSAQTQSYAPVATTNQYSANAWETSAGQQKSLVQQNPTSFTALGVVAGYLVLAFTTGIVLFGIFPVLLSVRAFNRGEKLAPLAAIGAAVAVLVAVMAFTAPK
jgi:hypothetical protein